MNAADLIQQIEMRRREALTARVSAYPRSHPIASDLGECEREMVLAIQNWKDRPLPDSELKARFERGNLIENAVVRELADLGFTVRVERTPFELKDKVGRIVVRGRVDGFISVDRKDFPFEVKSLNPNIFARIETADDFNKFHWAAKYPRQLQTYLYGNNLEEGLFLLDDCLGHWKLIPVSLDFEAMEKILKRCENSVAHIAEGTLPDFHKDPSVCFRCWAFGRACNPPINTGAGASVIEDADLQADLDRFGELRETGKEYNSLDGKLKKRFRGIESALCGDWIVRGEQGTKTFKAQEAHTIETWSVKFERLAVEAEKKEVAV